MPSKNEKRMAGNYEITHAVRIGGAEVVLGEDKANDNEPYLCAVYETNGILEQYKDCMVGANKRHRGKNRGGENGGAGTGVPHCTLSACICYRRQRCAGKCLWERLLLYQSLYRQAYPVETVRHTGRGQAGKAACMGARAFCRYPAGTGQKRTTTER